MEINNIRGGYGVSGMQHPSQGEGVPSSSHSGGLRRDENLTITYAKGNALEEMNRADGIEEPRRDDALGSKIRELFNYVIPPMPDFV